MFIWFTQNKFFFIKVRCICRRALCLKFYDEFFEFLKSISQHSRNKIVPESSLSPICTSIFIYWSPESNGMTATINFTNDKKISKTWIYGGFMKRNVGCIVILKLRRCDASRYCVAWWAPLFYLKTDFFCPKPQNRSEQLSRFWVCDGDWRLPLTFHKHVFERHDWGNFSIEFGGRNCAARAEWRHSLSAQALALDHFIVFGAVRNFLLIYFVPISPSRNVMAAIVYWVLEDRVGPLSLKDLVADDGKVVEQRKRCTIPKIQPVDVYRKHDVSLEWLFFSRKPQYNDIWWVLIDFVSSTMSWKHLLLFLRPSS